MSGLNENDRKYVAKLVEQRRPSEFVRDALSQRVRDSNWSYQKNVRFMGWLMGKGYHVSAERLAHHLEK